MCPRKDIDVIDLTENIEPLVCGGMYLFDIRCIEGFCGSYGEIVNVLGLDKDFRLISVCDCRENVPRRWKGEKVNFSENADVKGSGLSDIGACNLNKRLARFGGHIGYTRHNIGAQLQLAAFFGVVY